MNSRHTRIPVNLSTYFIGQKNWNQKFSRINIILHALHPHSFPLFPPCHSPLIIIPMATVLMKLKPTTTNLPLTGHTCWRVDEGIWLWMWVCNKWWNAMDVNDVECVSHYRYRNSNIKYINILKSNIIIGCYYDTLDQRVMVWFSVYSQSMMMPGSGCERRFYLHTSTQPIPA